MKRGSRIPSLLRELADAFDELLAAEPAPPRRRRVIPPTGPEPRPEAMAKVRRSLRRQGVAA